MLQTSPVLFVQEPDVADTSVPLLPQSNRCSITNRRTLCIRWQDEKNAWLEQGMATDSLSVALQENNQSSEQANKPIADKLAIHDLGYGVWKDLDKGPTMKVNKMAVVKKLAMGQVFRNQLFGLHQRPVLQSS